MANKQNLKLGLRIGALPISNYQIENMARSLKKGPYIEAKLENKVLAMTEGKTKKGVIKTWSRRSTITPDFVGHTFAA